MSVVTSSKASSAVLPLEQFPPLNFQTAISQGHIEQAKQVLQSTNWDCEDLVHYLVFCLKRHKASFLPLYDTIFNHSNFGDPGEEHGEAKELLSKALVYASYYQLADVVDWILGYSHVDAPFTPMNPENNEEDGIGPVADYGIRNRFGYEEALYVAVRQGILGNVPDSQSIVKQILDIYEGFAEDEPERQSSYLPREMLEELLLFVQNNPLATLISSYLKTL
ncbi:MAG: hypothetical protein K1000chlam3_00887 [Chlamydiae bacterium]|nr:hypothetical protein [Chlamydiota bacterium]